jgi:hypothetical protein
MMSTTITYEPGGIDDNYAAFLLFEEALADLVSRFGFAGTTSWEDADKLAEMWQRRRPLYEHISQTSAQFWLAKQNGSVVGFSRSVERDGGQELTELFVKPGIQSGGVGSELITRAFPLESAKRRFIIATPDFRAQALYLKSGVFPRFPIYYFGRQPEPVDYETDVQFVPLVNSEDTIMTLATIDANVLDFKRDLDHRWFLANRQGYLYVRNGRPEGYGYIGKSSGPFALLNAADFPTVLAHAENMAHAEGNSQFGVEVPMVNETAVTYLLSRQFKIDSFMAMFMSDRPFGNFDRYIMTSPPFFV